MIGGLFYSDKMAKTVKNCPNRPIAQEPAKEKSFEEIFQEKAGAKRKAALYRKKYARKLNAKRRAAKEAKLKSIMDRYSNTEIFKLASYHEERLSAAYNELVQKGIKVCGFDIENIKVKTLSGKRSMPVWIGIVDGVGNIRFNEIIRYPRISLPLKIHTAYRGLTWEEFKYGRCFALVRAETVKILLEYDIICVSSEIRDFLSIIFEPEEYEQIKYRIRDVTGYYNCRQNHGAIQALGLKFSIFIMFQRIIYKRQRSPVVDAGYTLFLYLVDYQRFEEAFNLALPKFIFKQSGLLCWYQYEGNYQMGGLVQRICDYLTDWPYQLRQGTKKHWKWKPAYNKAKFISNPHQQIAPYDISVEQFEQFKCFVIQTWVIESIKIFNFSRIWTSTSRRRVINEVQT